MIVTFKGNTLAIDGESFVMPWSVLEAIEVGGRVFVLFDPDSYLLDPKYRKVRREGTPAIKNLIALRKDGVMLWEADLPTSSDYYYHIVSSDPLIANSFSSYRCEIDSLTGTIKRMDFFK